MDGLRSARLSRQGRITNERIREIMHVEKIMGETKLGWYSHIRRPRKVMERIPRGRNRTGKAMSDRNLSEND